MFFLLPTSRWSVSKKFKIFQLWQSSDMLVFVTLIHVYYCVVTETLRMMFVDELIFLIEKDHNIVLQ